MHDLLTEIELTKESGDRAGYFLKIEELQLVTFLSLCQALQPSHVLDIGANVGFYTLVTHKYFPDVKFDCFEPTPSTFAHLSTNVKSNGGSAAIKVHNIALSSSSGTLNFSDFDNLSGKNAVTETSIHQSDGATQLLVNSNPLDEVIALTNQRILIKIDTEGHEMEVLKGASNLLQQNQCVIQIETEHGKDTEIIHSHLRSLGYNKQFALGPDAYYSNSPDFGSSEQNLNLLTDATRRFIDIRWHNRFSL